MNDPTHLEVLIQFCRDVKEKTHSSQHVALDDLIESVRHERKQLKATSRAAAKFMAWMETWYSVRGKVKRNYDIEEDNELAQIYWEMKEPD